MNRRVFIGSAVLLAASLLLSAQRRGPGPTVELLWPDGAPGAVGNEEKDRPTLSIYAPDPELAVGTAVVVCPGGGYGALAVDHEGDQIARWLNSLGIHAFVLRYRIAPRYKHPAPIQDARRAVRTVRSRAAELGYSPERIGIWGFSAGGHLSATASTWFEKGDPKAADPVERVTSRPDFAILAYPVITFTQEDATHKGSRRNLLGENPAPDLVRALSAELRVTADTPPTFLFHTNADTGVPPENSVLYYLALRKANVPAEMHIYEPGPHGVGLASMLHPVSSWPQRLADWMRVRGLLRR